MCEIKRCTHGPYVQLSVATDLRRGGSAGEGLRGGEKRGVKRGSPEARHAGQQGSCANPLRMWEKGKWAPSSALPSKEKRQSESGLMDVLRVTMVGDDVARKENVAYMHHGTAGIAGMVTVYNGLDQPCLLVPPQQQGWPRHDDGILQKKLALNFDCSGQ